MGPITLFDKSFLQSLSVDESLWFDRFFFSVICPIFYVETLADLKKPKLRRPPEQEVGIIADKFPEMHCAPTVHHQEMAIGDLLGNHVPLTGQIPRDPSRFVASDGHKGVIFEGSPEEEAFLRWQSREFDAIEHEFASVWRANLESRGLEEIASELSKLGISGRNCKSLSDAKLMADAFVSRTGQLSEIIKLAILFLEVPKIYHQSILNRWSLYNCPSLLTYAPYAAYVLTVEVFFWIALEANLISSNRPSNRLDIAYLYYLPFCQVFVSWDKLHRRCAPLFLRENQTFIWGPKLKSALSVLNQHYCALPESEKGKGVMHFAPYPPTEIESIVSQEWDKYLYGWREYAQEPPIQPDPNPEIVKELTNLTEAPPLQPEAVNFNPEDANVMVVKRRVHKTKGKWWQLPRDLEDNDGEKR